MEIRDYTEPTMQDCERKAQELISMVLAMCEQRLLQDTGLNSPVGAALSEAALAVKSSIRTFVFIERLPGE